MNKEIQRLKKNIVKAQARIKELQDICLHTNTTKKYGADTGNYDPHADRYWIDFHCLDCDKHWTEDQ